MARASAAGGVVVKGLLFKSRLAVANVERRKSVTRRVGPGADRLLRLEPGEIVYQKETWRPEFWIPGRGSSFAVRYRADKEVVWTEEAKPYFKPEKSDQWRPSIFLPAVLGRCFLEITEAPWKEPLQEITESGAVEEGLPPAGLNDWPARSHFEALWDDTNAARGYGWEDNPDVVVVPYRVVEVKGGGA